MNVPTIWGRLSRLVLLLVVAAAALLVMVWYLPLIRQNQTMRQQLLRLEAEKLKEEEKLHQRKAAVQALRHDAKTVERVARERLGLARTGETVVHFESSVVATNPPPSLVAPAR